MTQIFQVIDNRTGYVMRVFKTRVMARRYADKLDLEYGAIRYYVKTIFKV